MAKPASAFVVLAAAVAKKSAARSGSLRTETGGQPNKNDILRRSRERIGTRSFLVAALLLERSHEHPYELLLLAEPVAHHGAGSLVAGFLSGSQHHALLGDELFSVSSTCFKAL